MTHEGGPTGYRATFAAIVLTASIGAALPSAVNPALLSIQRSLHASSTAAAWILTIALLTGSVMTPIMGNLGDMFGKRRILLCLIGSAAIGSVVCATAQTIGQLIVGRAFHGASVAFFPLCYGIIRDEFPVERVRSGIAFISALVGIAGAGGIILAGPVTDQLSWHWLFWFALCGNALSLAGVLFFVKESPVRAPGRIDWAGSLGLAAWVVTLLLGISEGARWGWSSGRIVGLFAASVLLLLIWTRIEGRSPAPLVDMRLMRLRGMWTTNAAAVLSGMGLFATSYLVPLYAQMPKSQYGFGFSTNVTHGAFFLVPQSVAILVVGLSAGRLMTRFGGKPLMVIGLADSAAGLLLVGLAHSHPWQVYLWMAMTGIGIGLWGATMVNLIIENAPIAQVGVATGINMIMRTIGAAFGGQIAGVILASTFTSGHLSDRGFTISFLTMAAAMTVGGIVALGIPTQGRVPAVTLPEDVAIAAATP